MILFPINAGKVLLLPPTHQRPQLHLRQFLVTMIVRRGILGHAGVRFLIVRFVQVIRRINTIHVQVRFLAVIHTTSIKFVLMMLLVWLLPRPLPLPLLFLTPPFLSKLYHESSRRRTAGSNFYGHSQIYG